MPPLEPPPEPPQVRQWPFELVEELVLVPPPKLLELVLVEELVDELVEELVDELVEELVEELVDTLPLDEEVEDTLPLDVEVELPPVEVEVELPPVEVEVDPPLVDVDVETPLEVETFPVEVDTLPVEVETAPELVDAVMITLPPLELDPPKKPPLKKPPPKPKPAPPLPPTTTTPLLPPLLLPGNSAMGGGGGGTKGTAGGGVIVRVTVRVVTAPPARPAPPVGTQAVRLTVRRTTRRCSPPARRTWAVRTFSCFTTAGRGGGFSATWTAPPPMMAPPQVHAQSFAKAILTDISAPYFLASAASGRRSLQYPSAGLAMNSRCKGLVEAQER